MITCARELKMSRNDRRRFAKSWAHFKPRSKKAAGTEDQTSEIEDQASTIVHLKTNFEGSLSVPRHARKI